MIDVTTNPPRSAGEIGGPVRQVQQEREEAPAGDEVCQESAPDAQGRPDAAGGKLT